MASNMHGDSTGHEDATIPSSNRTTAQIKPTESRAETVRLPGDAPWLLRQYYDEQVDLAAELVRRYPNHPLMTVIRLRKLDESTGRGMVTLATADGVATVSIESDPSSGFTELSFTYASMMSLRFSLNELSGMDRLHWLAEMRREVDGVAFLWGQARWEQDYLISTSRQGFTSLFAFGRSGIEAAVRMTPEIKDKLLSILDIAWKFDEPPQDTGKLLTW